MKLEYAQSNLEISADGLQADIYLFIKTPQYQQNNQQHRVKLKYELERGIDYPISRLRTRFRTTTHVQYIRFYHDKITRKYWARIKITSMSLFPRRTAEEWTVGDNSVEHLTNLIATIK